MDELEKQIAESDEKKKIRNRYKGIDPSELEVIPAKPVDEISLSDKRLKVAAYVRVSTDNDEQTSSFELQKNDFTERIKANPNWEFVGIYSDEGISGTELSHRKGMLQMIEDARAGKIEHILAKSIARFARNVVDCLSIIEELRQINVGVHFDENNLYTLDTTGALVLTILATVAEEESRSKSFIMNWSIERRFSKGIFLLPKPLGFEKDDEGNLIIEENEAETVKVIYDLYVNGWTYSRIARELEKYGRKTKPGNKKWHASCIKEILGNERNCGDVLSRKTYTPNFKTHKSKKNNNNRNQYRKKDHHESIVSREVYDAAKKMQAAMKFSKGNRTMPVLSVVEEGALKGYVPIHKDWTGFSGEEYQAASRSIKSGSERIVSTGKRINLEGYQRVSASLFPTSEKPMLTISNGRMRFNTACMRKFRDVEYVELLLNSVSNQIAIRPCEKDNPNAIRWARLRNEKWVVSPMTCRGLFGALEDIVNWTEDSVYKLCGQLIEEENAKILLFSLEEPDVIKKVEHVVIPEKPDGKNGVVSEETNEEEGETLVIFEKIREFPACWAGSFGVPVKSIDFATSLKRIHYSGDWDVFRPAKEIEGMNFISKDKLRELLLEAEQIMERWSINGGNNATETA